MRIIFESGPKNMLSDSGATRFENMLTDPNLIRIIIYLYEINSYSHVTFFFY